MALKINAALLLLLILNLCNSIPLTNAAKSLSSKTVKTTSADPAYAAPASQSMLGDICSLSKYLDNLFKLNSTEGYLKTGSDVFIKVCDGIASGMSSNATTFEEVTMVAKSLCNSFGNDYNVFGSYSNYVQKACSVAQMDINHLTLSSVLKEASTLLINPMSSGKRSQQNPAEPDYKRSKISSSIPNNESIKSLLEEKKRQLEEKMKSIPKVNPLLPKASLSTIKANIRGAKKELKIEKPRIDIHNPYYDPSIGVSHERGSRKLKFGQKGKWIAKANQERDKARLEDLQEKLKSNVKKAGLEDTLVTDSLTLDKTPQAEWWDLQFLPSKDYADIENGSVSYEFVTQIVYFPAVVEPPAEEPPEPPKPLMLTKTERKKLRRQRRLSEHQERQEKIRLGLLPPDPPKLKLSNVMKVLTNQAVQDPTQVEAMVRAQMEQRQAAHEASNESRKLTEEQKKEKKQKKLAEDTNVQVHVAVFKIVDLSHPKWQFKVDVNAQQNGLTGCAVLCRKNNLVIVEGGPKSIKRYKHLMLERIDWNDRPPSKDDQVPVNPDLKNECFLVWEGILKSRAFKLFTVNKFVVEAQAIEFLTTFGADTYYQYAKDYKKPLIV